MASLTSVSSDNTRVLMHCMNLKLLSLFRANWDFMCGINIEIPSEPSEKIF